MTYAVTHFTPLTYLRRARLLPVAGRVQVRQGQRVVATDVIASADLNNEHVFIDVRRALHLARTEQAEALIEYKVGEKLQAGDIIAQTGGLFKRIVRAPVDGMVVAISKGQVTLEVPKTPFDLLAGLEGTVMEVIPERGAILETHGALVQGIWGNGKISQGVLLPLAESPEDALTVDRLDVSMRGGVVLAGTCSSAEAIKTAGDLPLRGLILGSMTADLIPLAMDAPCPIILTDGFGLMGMNTQAFRILATNEKRDVCLNACVYDPFAGERPEVVIPLPAQGKAAAEVSELKPGLPVRLLGAPYHGKIGTFLELLPGLTELSNHLRVPAARVRLENEMLVTVPVMNLDVLE
ncbi:MAG: hypothetical protein WHV66_06780 [Anaerolineales bacterium]|jgi:hypothetical protein